MAIPAHCSLAHLVNLIYMGITAHGTSLHSAQRKLQPCVHWYYNKTARICALEAAEEDANHVTTPQ